MKTGFLSHPDFKLHSNGVGHPERPERLEAIEKALKTSGLWNQVEHLQFEAATEADLALCHTPEHIERIKEMALSGGGQLDGDTRVGPESFEVATLASGAAIRAVEAVLKGEVNNAFVAERPCGHHAESGKNPNALWGFCLFNHVAIAARVAQRDFGVKKLAILDFDVHHGNGTQEIFYSDPSVLFVSLHQSPLFPYQGHSTERGAGAGVGTTLNYPLPAGSDGSVYRSVWTGVGEEVKKFAPELIILSAGYDAHRGDPLANMQLEVEDYAGLVEEAKGWAQEVCEGRLVAVLEGGYNLDALAQSVAETVQVLLGEEK